MFTIAVVACIISMHQITRIFIAMHSPLLVLVVPAEEEGGTPVAAMKMFRAK